MKNKKFWLGKLVIVLVFGMAVVGCASYWELMDRTTPGWRDQKPIQVFPDGSRSASSSGSSNSSDSCRCGSMCFAGWISSTEYGANADGCTNSGCRVGSAMKSGEAARNQPTLSCNCH